MNEDQMSKAAGFLITMRPGDHSFATRDQQLRAYTHEVRAHLQVLAALKMAGLAGRRAGDRA